MFQDLFYLNDDDLSFFVGFVFCVDFLILFLYFILQFRISIITCSYVLGKLSYSNKKLYQ